MSYTDINTPVIDKVRLPGYNASTGQGEYYVADRELRNAFEALSEIVSGGVTFIIAWDGTAAPSVTNIPEGVKVYYTASGSSTATEYIGTLTAADAQPGAFYLVKSITSPNLATTNNSIDVYDEYVRIQTGTNPATYTWEKIGDTQLNLTDIVVNASLNRQTDKVIGEDATFNITQPTITLTSETNTATGRVKITEPAATNPISVGTTDIVSVLTGLGTATTDKAIGEDATFSVTQPTITLVANDVTATGRKKYLEDVEAAKRYITSSTTVTPGNDDLVNAVTGYNNTNSANFINNINPVNKYLSKATVYGVNGSNTTTASKATAATSQITISGITNSSDNTDILKGISVNNGVLIFGATQLTSQTTTQHTFSDVVVPIKDSTATTILTGVVAASSSNTVGSFIESFTLDSGPALTSLGTPTTDSVLGADTSFTGTTTNAISDSGDAQIVTDIQKTHKYLSATAANGNVSWGQKDLINAVTGYSPSTDNVLGEDTSFTLNTTNKYLAASASGANTTWNNKDSVTVLTDTTDVQVTKGTV